MSVTNNGKQKRNKKKKRLIKLLIIVIILFILLMLADTLLLQHRKNVDREQRKAEAIAALERVPTVTPTPAATFPSESVNENLVAFPATDFFTFALQEAVFFLFVCQ